MRNRLTDTESTFHMHHISYERIGNETFGDLMLICKDCHSDLHRFIDRMTAKGFARTEVMRRLGPYCVRRVIRTHELWKHVALYRHGNHRPGLQIL